MLCELFENHGKSPLLKIIKLIYQCSKSSKQYGKVRGKKQQQTNGRGKNKKGFNIIIIQAMYND